MPLFNFMPRFVEPIRRGLKTHTIRSHRKFDCKPGDTMYLYCGLRHPGAYRIIKPPACTKVEEILINRDGSIWIAEVQLHPTEMEQLARRDGFHDLADFMKHWDGKFPFAGTVNHWIPTDRTLTCGSCYFEFWVSGCSLRNIDPHHAPSQLCPRCREKGQ